MRATSAFVVFCITLTGAAQDGDKLGKRYGFDPNTAFFPQDTPKKALQSVVKAIENRRIDYFIAQLADPQFVDDTVQEYQAQIAKGSDKAKEFLAFDRLVDETTQYFLEDPTILKELRLFAKEAEEGDKEESPYVGIVKTIPGRKVFLKKIGGRWFLENRQQ